MRIPLRVAVGGVTEREALLIEGPHGWGECSPLPGYHCPWLKARAAAEEAASVAWPTAVRTVVEVNALIPALPAGDAEEAAAEAVAAGHRCLKVKVGSGQDDDLGRVAATRAGAGPDTRIRVDANGAWTVDEAVAMTALLAPFDVELVEQPVARLEDLAVVRRRVSVPVAADECIRDLDDARLLARLEAADAVVLKVQPLGGVWAALTVAETAGVPAIVTSMLETSVGLAAGLALAAALPDLPYACGLGTASLLAADVVADPLVAEAGSLTVRRPVPDPVLLERYRVAA